MNLVRIVDVLQALLTPAIAVLTTLIAYQQYRIRRDERALQLYDRRLKVYKSVMLMVDRVRMGDLLEMEELWNWVSAIEESHFLFGPEVQEVIDPLFEKLLEFVHVAEPRKYTSGVYDGDCASIAVDIEGYRTPLEEVFRPYLAPIGEGLFRRRRYSRRRIRKLLARCTAPIAPAEPTKMTSGSDDVPF